MDSSTNGHERGKYESEKLKDEMLEPSRSSARTEIWELRFEEEARAKPEPDPGRHLSDVLTQPHTFEKPTVKS